MDPAARRAYLDLLKQVLTRAFVVGEGRPRGRRRRRVALVMQLLANRGLVVVPTVPSTHARAVPRVPGLFGGGLLVRLLRRKRLAVVPAEDLGRIAASRNGRPRRALTRAREWDRRLARVEREFGLDWPEHAETMVGLRRLDNVERCIADVLERDVPGDLVEAGSWRGGTTIFMRAALAAYGDERRRVWVADSFQGLPKPDAAAFPADARLDYTGYTQLAVGIEQVKANFARYCLLDGRVEFLPGWFKDTLGAAPIDRIALMRLDGDLYESTIDALDALYPKLSVGGYCLIDDYGALDACRRAVDDFRARNGIAEEIETVDWTGAFWRRERA
jgi:O-methyltransferase